MYKKNKKLIWAAAAFVCLLLIFWKKIVALFKKEKPKTKGSVVVGDTVKQTGGEFQADRMISEISTSIIDLLRGKKIEPMYTAPQLDGLAQSTPFANSGITTLNAPTVVKKKGFFQKLFGL